MERNFARSLKAVLKHEGGYVNHPSDPGGATNKGITIATFRRYVKPGGTIADLKAITNDQVATVYRRRFWDAVRGSELPDGVDFAVFDFAVNSGPSRAIRYLQRVIGVKQDGVIGPATMAAVKSRMAATIINDLCDARLAFMKAIKKGTLWKTFGRGWSRRVSEVRSMALDMAARPADPPRPLPKPVVELIENADKPVSTTNIAAGIGTASGAVAVANEAADAVSGAKDALDTFMSVGPWVLLLIVIIGAGWWIWKERKAKQRLGAEARAHV